MSGESSKRSSLVDVTYQQLHSILSGVLEGTTWEQASKFLQTRTEQLSNVSEPFGKPSDTSKQKIEGGSVTLPDGVVLQVEAADKQYIYAISDKFGIDQVNALIVLRSFMYNEGLPSHTGSDSTISMVEELVEAITPFYHSERLSAMRVLIPLFRANENVADPLNEVSIEMLPKLIPNGAAFARTLITEYTRKLKERLPRDVEGDPAKALRWAKQVAKEQLVLLELLFWTMWGYVQCDGPMVASIFETAYGTNLGSAQENATLLLDDEGVQMQQDCAALWILITIEVLELEKVATPGVVQLSASPSDMTLYTSYPDSLQRIHELVMSNQDSQYAVTYLGWAFVLSRLAAMASDPKDIPANYRKFYEVLFPHLNRSFTKDREPTHVLMSRTCLHPDAGLFRLLSTLLTTSPLFVTALAWRTGSTVTDPNDIAFRSVFKGLLIALVELVPIELIPDFEGLVEVWIALFGRSESKSIAGICRQYWQSDWNQGIARRAIFDVARSRFPIHPRPLIRLLRAMTASGFLDTDPLSTADQLHEETTVEEDRDLCDQHVFFYLDKLSSFSQVISASACTGPQALYEKVQERFGTVSGSGLTYTNLRPIKLPGGTTLPARSIGRPLTGDGGEQIIISWQHEHSGWKVLLEILTDYVNRKRTQSGGAYRDVSFNRRRGNQVLSLRIQDVGMELDDGGEDAIVTDAFDLIRSVIQRNPGLAEELVDSLEAGEPVVAHTMTESQPPDLVQLTTMVLEEALSRPLGQARTIPATQLITSAMSVLSALLALPKLSSRVWLYIRSTNSLFGTERNVGFASVALSAERVTGHYTMTRALLNLVQKLFDEAASSILAVLPGNPKLQQVKEEVMLRATRFVHSEIWVEHLGWKYAQLGDRFAIGRRVTTLYSEILKQSPHAIGNQPFATLSQAVIDVLLFKATTSAINPLVASVASGNSALKVLFASRRYGDARRLIFLLESHLQLIRIVLNHKQISPFSTQSSLLEQALCSQSSMTASISDPGRSRIDPIDVLAAYSRERGVGNLVPLEAIRVLFALCSSLASSQPSPPTIVGQLSDPEATVTSLTRIIQHPYDELSLRIAVWNFIALAVDKEPALANLLVTGQSHIPGHHKGKQKAKTTPPTSAFDVARTVLSGWKELWELNPQLLCAVMRFLDMIWQHAVELKDALAPVRKDAEFWDQMAGIVFEELGPVPDYRTDAYVFIDSIRRSDLHDAVANHAYRTSIKSYALHIIACDMGQEGQRGEALAKPTSYLKIERRLKEEDVFADLIAEATPSSYDPELHDELLQSIDTYFPALTLNQIESQQPLVERDFGDDFAFSIPLLQRRLLPFLTSASETQTYAEEFEKQVYSINLNLSLARTQTSLSDSWQLLLRRITPHVRGDMKFRAVVLGIAASVSFDIASERRSGDMMASIHGTRLSLLLALLELVWFSPADNPDEVKSFMEVVGNVHGILLNEAQPPTLSFRSSVTAPFHRSLLQIMYFCTRHCRNLNRRPKVLNSDHRLKIAAMLEVSLALVIQALRVTFLSARSGLDVELDRDMELLAAVFEQCTRPDINPSSHLWLMKCQETDVIKVSLDLFTKVDLVGLSDLPLLLSRKQPLYVPHLLRFHMALSSVPSAAERFASEGVLIAYSNNGLTSAISAGMIDTSIPELPGERSPAHLTYCTVVSIVAGVVGALGRHNHYFDSEASGFVQLYGDQIIRALSWTSDDPLTFPLLEEMEQVVNLFYSIALSAPTAANLNAAVEKVLRVFSTHALLLLQQLNYALTHPNHLASVLEPVTAVERVLLEKDAADSSQDPLKRPLIARLMHRLFGLSNTILTTLVCISQADEVLTRQQEDWPPHEALVVPHSKVVLGEPASLGTLLEMGNSALDVLQELVRRPGGQALTLSTQGAGDDKPLNVKDGVETARRNLETVLVYAATQLAVYLSKPEVDGAGGDSMEAEDSLDGLRVDSQPKEQRRTSRVPTLAERLRRGMTGEMAADLQSLLSKAKPAIAKSDEVLGGAQVDLMPIISHFLQERISASQ